MISAQGAPSYKDAHSIASRISTSALVKTALYGEDAKYDIPSSWIYDYSQFYPAGVGS